MTSRLSPVVMLLVTLAAPLARADPEGRKAAAAAIFERGIADLQAGKTERACEQLAESVAVWPDSGAKGALAECDTALGRLSEAWALWHDLATSAPSAELRDDAAKNAAALDQKLVRVVMRVRGTAPPSLVVTINGKPMRALEKIEPRIEPGTLVVVATSADTAPWTQTFQAKGGATITLDIPLLPSASKVRERRWDRLTGLSLIGVGVAGLGVGAGFGLKAASNWNSATDTCGGTERCSLDDLARAQKDLDRARRAATISNWSIGLGAAMTAVGLYIYVSSRPEAPSTTAWQISPLAGPQTIGLTLSRGVP